VTIRGATIGCWIATTSPQQRSWDPHTALLIARGLKQHFDLAGHSPSSELGKAVEHTVRPGKIGTVLVHFD
jgi:hypothetical protein